MVPHDVGCIGSRLGIAMTSCRADPVGVEHGGVRARSEHDVAAAAVVAADVNIVVGLGLEEANGGAAAASCRGGEVCVRGGESARQGSGANATGR